MTYVLCLGYWFYLLKFFAIKVINKWIPQEDWEILSQK